MSQMDGDIPAHDGPPSFGCSQPHSPALRTPNTNSARPVADRTDPTQSRRGCFSTGESDIRRENNRIPAPITTSPANTQRHEKYVVQKPPTSGPDGDRHRSAGCDETIGAGRRSVGKFTATSATMAGMISAAPMPSRSDQPNIKTGRLGAIAVMPEPHM